MSATIPSCCNNSMLTGWIDLGYASMRVCVREEVGYRDAISSKSVN